MNSVLTSVLVLSGIATFLATLLVVVERVFIRRGPVTLKINDDTPVKIESGQTLLTTLRDVEIFIPSACGGRGSCGMCKAHVLKGGGTLLPTELPHLSDAERDGDVRLSCQIKVREDIEIEIPPELLDVKEYEVKVVAIEKLNHDTRRVRLEFDPGSGFAFVAGQYVQLETPIYDGLPTPTQRAYSIASTPSQPDCIDLIIRFVPYGIATTFVHELLQVGDQVKVNGPYGDFKLRDTSTESVFIAGGSGLAPFESILADMVEKGVDKKITLFFGAVSRRDLYDVEKLMEYEKLIPGFTFIPALSKPDAGDNWEGATGLITEVVGAHFETMKGMEAYLCGSPGMIDACISALSMREVEEDEIYFDKFS